MYCQHSACNNLNADPTAARPCVARSQPGLAKNAAEQISVFMRGREAANFMLTGLTAEHPFGQRVRTVITWEPSLSHASLVKNSAEGMSFMHGRTATASTLIGLSRPVSMTLTSSILHLVGLPEDK